LPVRITGTARSQYLGTVRRYLRATPQRAARPAAARKLIEAYAAAVEQIAAGPESWLTHPRPYPDLAGYGFRWIKIHRYWFGYLAGEAPIITNILDEVADIPARVSGDRTPTDVA
jgi:plasmid stabilization system protein ParE